MLYVSVFAALVFIMQQVDQTGFFFSVCSVIFIVTAGIAFNVAGGLAYPSGGYVFSYALLAVIIGLILKILVGEAADSNLPQAKLTIEIYSVGMLMMLMSVIVSKRLTRKTGWLQNVSSLENMKSAATGCAVVGVTIAALTHVLVSANGSLLSALSQVNHFPELAIILGVTYEVRRSGGLRSINLPVILGSLLVWINGGILGYSKQALFTPPICWAFAAAAQRYKLTRAQLIGGVIFLALMVRFMVPYAQFGRNLVAYTFRDNVKISFSLLTHLEDTRRRYIELNAASSDETVPGYFNKNQGFLDRLQMIYIDSLLIDATEKLGPYGLSPMKIDIYNLVPHFLWKDKPSILFGNVFAHEAGVDIPEEDETTGVSFTPTAEAYHMAKWMGILVVAPLLWTACFIWFDSLCGDVRKSPWGLLAIILFAHQAPEGMLDGVIYTMGYGALSIIFAAVTSAYVTPILGALIAGPGGRSQIIKTQVRGLPNRVSPLETPEPEGA